MSMDVELSTQQPTTAEANQFPSYKAKLVNLDTYVINKTVYSGLEQLHLYSEEENIIGNEAFIPLNTKEKSV